MSEYHGPMATFLESGASVRKDAGSGCSFKEDASTEHTSYITVWFKDSVGACTVAIVGFM